MKKVAIDLTWVRHNKVGGTESCVRNLLDGFTQINTKGIVFVLMLTKDNAESFIEYEKADCFELKVCDVNSENQRKRVIWQNTKMGKTLRKLDINICLEPIYGKPFFGTRGIDFITTIHDLQAKHYPQYFSKARVAWMKASWKNSVKSSKKIIAISKYVKDDIVDTYHISSNKVHVIYDAIALDTEMYTSREKLKDFGVDKGKYYYTVSSLFLHKNLKTAVLAIGELKKRNSEYFYPLVVSGIGGRKRDELDKLIAENGLQNDIIFTTFIETAERNMLYKNCRAFVFSSIFEGFGMPPLEAMAFGTPVLMTRCTSLEEVSGALLNYVDEPCNPNEWADKLEDKLNLPTEREVCSLLSKYDEKTIANQYIDLLTSLM